MLTPDQLFILANAFIVPPWLMLAFAPHHRLTERLVHTPVAPAVLCALYIAALIAGAALEPPPPADAGFQSLRGVMVLFDAPWGALVGWVHYLAFDLFIGAWEVRDARTRNIPHRWVLPCLLFTLMLGPSGLLLYLAVRRWRGQPPTTTA